MEKWKSETVHLHVNTKAAPKPNNNDPCSIEAAQNAITILFFNKSKFCEEKMPSKASQRKEIVQVHCKRSVRHILLVPFLSTFL